MQKDFIDFLKERASALDIVPKYVKLIKKGKDWFGRCPFHSEKTGSFKVDANLGLYYCFGCGAHGDMINFVMEMEKLSFAEAVKHIADMYGIQVPEDRENFRPEDDIKNKMYAVMEIAKEFFVHQLNSDFGREAKEYLKNRNISDESILKFQLGFASNEEKLVDQLKKNGFSEEIIIKTGLFFKNQYKSGLISKFSGRITFPIIDYKGKCVGFGGRIIKKIDAAKYINSPETEIFIKNHQLYGYSLARKSKSREIILVEGYLDVIAMHQAGFDATVAPLGTAISETQINMCWRVCDNPIICLDGDSAGVKASFRWLDKILPVLIPGKSFRFARLPQDSDPDSLILNDQCDIISSSLNNALFLSDWMWEGAFLLYPSETPEQKAAIIKMLKEKTGQIKDGSIQRLYIQYMKQKENELYRYKGKTFKPKIGELIRPATSVKEKIEKILVVTIINHPYIIDRVIEDFTKLEFASSAMIKLKEEILRIYDAYHMAGKVEEGNRVISELEKNISDIEKDIEIHAKFAGKNESSEDKILSGWNSFFEKYLSVPMITEDLHKASISLQSTFSESDWQRLKALKNSTLLAAKNRGKQ
jgi:DNA primase